MNGIIDRYLENTESAAIAGHVSPDGDCIGSGCGMAQALRLLGYDAYVAMPDILPGNMEYLGIEDLLADPSEYPEFAGIAVDCSEAGRMGCCGGFFDREKDPVIIDHHVSVSLTGDKVWIDGDASSASELCYYVVSALEEKTGKRLIDPLVARCFITGIVTDTGRFTYTNTRPETLVSAGELVSLGGNITEVSYNLYDRKTKENFMASAFVRTNVKFFEEGRIALAVASAEDIAKFGATDDAIEELPSALRDVDGVELSIVLRETEGVVRCNLRSNSFFDCSVFAAGFGGGGHIRAAGFTAEGDINEIADKVVRAACKRLG